MWPDFAQAWFKSYTDTKRYSAASPVIGNIDYVTQVTHLLFFDCKIGDFKTAGRVCLEKKVCLPSLLQGIFWWFLKLCTENDLDGSARITSSNRIILSLINSLPKHQVETNSNNLRNLEKFVPINRCKLELCLYD